MPPVFIFYSVLAALTFYLAAKATSLKGKDLEKTTFYELTDRASWILGGLLLATLPLWWKWPIQSILGAILVPLVGIILTGGIAQLTLETIIERLEAKSKTELVRKLISLVIFCVLTFLLIRFIIDLLS